MIYTTESQLEDLSAAILSLNEKFAAFLKDACMDRWIPQEEACVITGLEPYQLAYQAKEERVRTKPIPGKARGKYYSRYDCEMLALRVKDKKKKGGCTEVNSRSLNA